MKEKIDQSKSFLKKNIRLSVMIIAFLLGILIFTTSYSYAFFTISFEKQNSILLIAGMLQYELSDTTGSSLDLNQVHALAKRDTNVYITVTSENDIDTKYQVYINGKLPEGVYVRYAYEKPEGIIEQNGNVSIERITIENYTEQEVIIDFDVTGGLLTDEIKLTDNATPITEQWQEIAPIISFQPEQVEQDIADTASLLDGVRAVNKYGTDITQNLTAYCSSCTNSDWENRTLGDNTVSYNVVDDASQSSRTRQRNYRLYMDALTTNLVLNGSFEDGFDHWEKRGDTELLIIDSSFHLYGNFAYVRGRVEEANSTYLSQPISVVNGHLYYMRGRGHTNGYAATAQTIAFDFYLSGGFRTSVAPGEIKLLSQILKFDGTTGIHDFNVNFDQSTEWTYLDGMLIVDLTASFGMGNEPSLEWCDVNLDYFDGSKLIRYFGG